jgi:hypothetical protein
MMIIDPKDRDHYKHLAEGEYWGEQVTFALTDEEYAQVTGNWSRGLSVEPSHPFCQKQWTCFLNADHEGTCE